MLKRGICQGDGMCTAMRRDTELNDALIETRQSTPEQKDALARVIAALANGQCNHCKRPVREEVN